MIDKILHNNSIFEDRDQISLAVAEFFSKGFKNS